MKLRPVLSTLHQEWEAEVSHHWNRISSLLSLADHSTRHLTYPPVEHFDSQPSFSPDGKRMAFVRTSSPGAVDDLFLIPIDGGVPRRLTFDNREIYGPPAWTEGGKDLIFSSARAGLQSLWRLPVAGGDPRLVAEASTNAYYPAISTKSHRLAYTRRIDNNNIWQLTLKDRTHGQGKASMMIAAQGNGTHPQFSPNGTKIAFQSDRSGYWKFGSATGMAPIQHRLLLCAVWRARRAGRRTGVPWRSTSAPRSTAKFTWLMFPGARPGR
jgi:Tol biopolymer transport system component